MLIRNVFDNTARARMVDRPFDQVFRAFSSINAKHEGTGLVVVVVVKKCKNCDVLVVVVLYFNPTVFLSQIVH
ncbi:hypothetical protein L596_010624 [Steinernema carpocapsae]|uniref:Uncharacterized protein n=1 Tax=Steinernema carpocapsae TaxID=34508 RepID=A0A4U5PJ10_STECR|nr:hypothetical protein L596_010624 [Steinernema carpocapsae]